MEGLTIKPCEFFLVLNSIADENLYFRLPLYGIELFKISYFNGSVKGFYAFDSFNSFEGRVGAVFGRSVLSSCPDIPRFSMFRDALLSAGVIDPSNLSELNERLRGLGPSLEEPVATFLAIDTNILYNRLLSRISIKGLPVIVSGCVLEEIGGLWRQHVDSKSLKILRKIQEFPGCYKVNILKNRTRSVKGRRAIAAFREYGNVKKFYKVYETVSRKCFGDKAIIEDYADFKNKYRCKILLLTFDDEARAYAYGKGISNFFIKTPEQFSIKKIPLQLIPELVYNLAVNFLMVEIRGDKGWARVYSWWPSQKLDDALQGLLFVELPKDKVVKMNKRLGDIREIGRLLSIDD